MSGPNSGPNYTFFVSLQRKTEVPEAVGGLADDIERVASSTWR